MAAGAAGEVLGRSEGEEKKEAKLQSGEVIKNLQEFNRKERFYLVGAALGKPRFKLSEDFRSRLDSAFAGSGVSVPSDAFAAMDYHLDWVYASLFLARYSSGTVFPPAPQITATQEDIDLLIAYPDKGVCHLIFLEAKGVFGFTNRQMKSKANRLRLLFGKNGDEKWSGVVPHFAIVSPHQPTDRLKTEGWSTWMQPVTKSPWKPWIKLKLPEDLNLKKITLCDALGNPKRGGPNWKVELDPLGKK